MSISLVRNRTISSIHPTARFMGDRLAYPPISQALLPPGLGSVRQFNFDTYSTLIKMRIKRQFLGRQPSLNQIRVTNVSGPPAGSLLLMGVGA